MSSSYAPCAACKYLRRKCTQECVFAPYFPPDNPQKFINVHKVFGASNVGKILNDLNPNQRNEAVNSLAYEAECRIKDPIYGCVGFVSFLQHRLRQVQQELERAKKELATYIGPAAMQPIPNNPAQIMQHQQQNFDSSTLYQMGPYQGQGQLVIQEPPQQNQREHEMLRAFAQQQQLQQEQLYAQQQQELYAQQQQRMQQQQGIYVQQQQNEIVRFNDGGDGFVQIPGAGAAEGQPTLALVGDSFETHYQAQEEQAHSHHQQQHQIQELLLQSPQHLTHQFGAQPQGSQSQRDGTRSFGPLQ